MQEPVTFSPNLHAVDPCVNYWLRQVTLRLRREICWCWHERGRSSEAATGTLPPIIDKLSASLDISRYWDEKIAFFESDPTAKYLTDQLQAAKPRVESNRRGTLPWVIETLGLDDTATFVLALGLAIAFDNAMESVVAASMNETAKVHPTLALAQKLWEQPEQVLSLVDPAHPLFRYGLLQQISHTAQASATIVWERPITVPALVVNQLLFPDWPLPCALEKIVPNSEAEAVVTGSARLVSARLKAQRLESLRLVPILGPSGAAHAEIVRSIVRATGRDAVVFKGAANLLEDSHYLNALATLCWLRGIDLFLEPPVVAALNAAKQRLGLQGLPLQSIPCTIFLGITERQHLEGIAETLMLPIVETPRFDYHERVAHWKKALGTSAQGLDAVIAEYSRRFRYEKDTISAIAEGLKGLPQAISEQDFAQACRVELDLNIGELAQKVTPRFDDETLILPHKQRLLFEEIVNAMRSLTDVHYTWGTAKVWNESGISVLFAGPPGTGKTMAAEILAIQLNLPMYRIDLSQVVNKYIGETEKNLKQLFDAADISDTILFFDEADALFGKRTEVKDAHDRYANLEISYLLERMERFKGLAILATNRKNDLDEAFLRRLRYIIDFPMPDVEERKRIWRQVIPKTVYDPLRFCGELTAQASLDDAKISDELRQAFEKHNIALSEKAKVLTKKADNEWLIIDEGHRRMYAVRKAEAKLNVYDESTIDFNFLAKAFPLAGGHIRSIVFNACLQSASDFGARKELTMERLVIAVKREYDKLHRTVSLEHFGSYADIVKKLEP